MTQQNKRFIPKSDFIVAPRIYKSTTTEMLKEIRQNENFNPRKTLGALITFNGTEDDHVCFNCNVYWRREFYK